MTVTQEGKVAEQTTAMIDKIRMLNYVAEIPDQIKELEEKLRTTEHKLTFFEEKGVSEKLEKQTACNADGVKLEDIIKEAKNIKRLLDTFLLQYDTSAVSLSGHISKYNTEIFQKVHIIIVAFYYTWRYRKKCQKLLMMTLVL